MASDKYLFDWFILNLNEGYFFFFLLQNKKKCLGHSKYKTIFAGMHIF